MTNPSRERRRRGAMFTIMVLVTATILLAVGGAFVGATRNLTQRSGTSDQLEQAKEALAGATEWARVEASAWAGRDGPERRSSSATLKLSRATVDVKLESTVDGIRCQATATVKPDVRLAASALLVRRDGRWVVTSFAFQAVPSAP